MIQAKTENNTRRRDFLTVTAAVATTVMAARPALASSPDDSALLALEEQFFEQKDLADSYNGEIHRLSTICRVEGRRLYDKALAIEVQTGKFRAAEERWGLVGEMPESIECVRLERLQDAHHAKMEHLVKQMWAMPANTPEGRRAKVLVALNLLPDDWRVVDEHADWGIREIRQLLIEFIGGEPGERMRNQFS